MNEQIKYILELYLKYYELIKENIIQNSAKINKLTNKQMIMKNHSMEIINENKTNKNLTHDLFKILSKKNDKPPIYFL